jgi:D-serine deaminase-like pyridoxal phosphate-dependent protein
MPATSFEHFQLMASFTTTSEEMQSLFRRNAPAAGIRTPHIEINERALDRNLAAMQRKAADAGVALRPHIKTHKSLEIARRQTSLGAVGLTSSKPSEATVFVEAGFSDITLAYPIIDPTSVDVLLELGKTRNARVAFIAGSLEGAAAIAQAAARHARRLPCFLKVDVGLGRIGPKPGSPEALNVAKSLAADPGIEFAGLLSHAGHAYSATSLEQIGSIAAQEALEMTALAQRLGAEGIKVNLVSTGATPTALAAPIAAGIGEIRPGNYAFLDLTALKLGLCTADELALTVVARVVAVNDQYAIIDAGSKALSADTGPHGTGDAGYGVAVPADPTRIGDSYTVVKMSEEHGFLTWTGTRPQPGDFVRIYPKHSCAVVAQFDTVLFRSPADDARVLPVDARGTFA